MPLVNNILCLWNLHAFIYVTVELLEYSHSKCLVFFFSNYIKQLYLFVDLAKVKMIGKLEIKDVSFRLQDIFWSIWARYSWFLLNLMCLTFPFFNSSQELGKSFHSSLSLTSRYANECLWVSFFPFTHNTNAILNTTDLCILLPVVWSSKDWL